MPTTDAQDRRIGEYAERYNSLRVLPSVGPSSDRAVISCPDGRVVVLAADGEVLADSAEPKEVDWHSSLTDSSASGYDSAQDALLVERPDSEWALIPPWRAAMEALDHVPFGAIGLPLAELRAWASAFLDSPLRVYMIRRGKGALEPMDGPALAFAGGVPAKDSGEEGR